MNALYPMIDAPVWAVLLFKITAILAAAWAGHAALMWANPRWRVLLWRVTAVGLVVLPGVTLLLPGLDIRLTRPVVEDAAEMETGADEASPAADWTPATSLPGVSRESFFEGPTEAPIEKSLPAAAHVVYDLPPSETPNLVPTEPSSFPWSRLPLLSWLGGVALLGFRLCLGHRRLGMLARRAEPAPQWVRDEAARVAAAAGCRRRVDVVQSADVASPILCGLRRPLLILPSRMCDEAYRGDLPAILAHELAHAKAYDVPWNAFLQVLTAALWFHPLVWRVRKAHLAACELVSDAASAAFIGDVAGYCRTLARVAVDAHSPVPASGIAMARTSAIGRRLSALKRHVFHLPLRRRSVLAFGVAAFLGVAVLGTLRFALAEPAEVAEAAEAVATMEETGEKPAEEKAETSENEEDAAADEEEADAAPEPDVMRVKVLDPEGKPLPGAKIHTKISTKQTAFEPVRDYTTDARGLAEVELPKTYRIAQLWIIKTPYATVYSELKSRKSSQDKPPGECTIRLEKTVTAGGRIVDDEGKPIPGAEIQVMVEGGKPAVIGTRAWYGGWLARRNPDPANGEKPAAITDADGRWRIDNVPDNPETKLRVVVSHPDYVCDKAGRNLHEEAGTTTPMLLGETATVTPPRGVRIHGRVTGPDGEPIQGAFVLQPIDALEVRSHYPLRMGIAHHAQTDADGRFRLPAIKSGTTDLFVLAPEWAPQMRQISVGANTSPEDFQLEKGKTVEIRFVDTDGKPLPNVDVQLGRVGDNLWFINRGGPDEIDTWIPRKTDKDGVWRWTWAPEGLVIVSAVSEGLAGAQVRVQAGDPPQTVTLKPEHRMTGEVTDVGTEKAIPSFTVVPVAVLGDNQLGADRSRATSGKNGTFEYLATRTDVPLRLRIEADGYRVTTGPEFRVGDDSPRKQKFALRPSPPIIGMVVDDDGWPAQNVEVLLALPSEVTTLKHNEGSAGLVTKTDDGGRFRFPDPNEPFMIIARSDDGFAMQEFEAGQHDIGKLRLKPWATVEGRFFDGGRPVKGARIMLDLVRLDRSGRPRVYPNIYQILTDRDGRFEFPQVPPVPVNVRVDLGPWKNEDYRSAPHVPLDLQPGQKVDLQLGRGGTAVEGKVKLTGNVPAGLDCSFAISHLVDRSPGIEPPPSLGQTVFDIRKGWDPNWTKTPEGRTYIETLRRWFVKLTPDGSFRVSGVPAGEYDLSLDIYARPQEGAVELTARKVVPVTVTEEDVKRGTLTLPEIEAEVVPIAAVGDVPSLKFEDRYGREASIADLRGRYVVVRFWASWCGPCLEHLWALEQLGKRFAGDGFCMIGVSLDEDAQAWKESVDRIGMIGLQLKLVAPKESGVSTVPTYWLLDPKGKIIAKAFTVDQLREEIEKVNLPEAKKPETRLDETSTIRMNILDPEAKPVPDAKINVRYWPNNTDPPVIHECNTDRKGNAELTIRGARTQVQLSVSKKPYVSVRSIWVLDDLKAAMLRSGEVAIRLHASTTAGGRIVDKQGKPIAGAELRINSGSFGKLPRREPGYGEPLWSTFYFDTTKTDAEGRWRVEGIPDDPDIPLSLRVSDEGYSVGWSAKRLKEEAGITTAMLLDESAVLTFERSGVIEGRVTGPDGKPIDGAIIVSGERPYNPFFPVKVPTGADGRFKMPPRRPGKTTLTVVAPDVAPSTRDVDVRFDMPPEDFQMKPGKTVELTFVDSAGKPVPGVRVDIVKCEASDVLQTLYNPPDPKLPDVKLPRSADENGVWRWTSAPEGDIRVSARASGFLPRQIELEGGAGPRTVTLEASE